MARFRKYVREFDFQICANLPGKTRSKCGYIGAKPGFSSLNREKSKFPATPN